MNLNEQPRHDHSTEPPEPNQLLAELEAKRGQLLGVPDWTYKRLMAAEAVCEAVLKGEAPSNDCAIFKTWHKLWSEHVEELNR